MDDQAVEPKQVEPKQPEPAPKEHEAVAKEKESHSSQWTHPLVIGLLGATLALAGNIATNILNNRASAEAEHFRAQSNLVLSVIKTNGNVDDACKNLNFFVNIGWLDDPKGTIHNVCGTKSGVPTLPASSSGTVEGGYGSGGYGVGGFGVGGLLSTTVLTLTVRVEDADSHKPIANAKVDLEQPSLPLIFQPQTPILGQPQGSTVLQSTATSATGEATLNFVSSSFENLAVSKDGYESVVKPTSQFALLSTNPAIALIGLHRVPTAKH
jgi:hypothetical protein